MFPLPFPKQVFSFSIKKQCELWKYLMTIISERGLPAARSAAREAIEFDKKGFMGKAMNKYIETVDMLFILRGEEETKQDASDIVEMIGIYLARVDEILRNAPLKQSISTPTTIVTSATLSPTVLSVTPLLSCNPVQSLVKPLISPLISPLLVSTPQTTPRSCLRFVQSHEVDPLAVAVHPLFALGQPEILWVSPVRKRGRNMKRLLGRSRIEKRCTALTPTAIFTGKDKRLTRCVPLSEISEVIIGGDMWIGVRVPSQYDFLFMPTNGDVPTKISSLASILTELCSAHGYSLKIIHCDQLNLNELKMNRPRGWEQPPFLKIPVGKISTTPSSGRRNAVAVPYEDEDECDAEDLL